MPMPMEANDKRLRRAVLASLTAEPSLSTSHIGVAAKQGDVTLSGYVTSNLQKGAACAAAKRVDGVSGVTDEMGVAIPAASADREAVRPVIHSRLHPIFEGAPA